ncbi:MAG: AbrB/MazE/SpoVT family DNA-binding domain-containing protein [Synergistaceae bacterium]|nr:AbrB/MazE/SpoVT family DNA-binding domain-containing protein [Synergistaceae bacterium]
MTNLARISETWQITVPFDVRKILGLRSGDKVAFEQNENGEIILYNASAGALERAQKAFEGVAEMLGIKNEDDVQALVDEVRYGR